MNREEFLSFERVFGLRESIFNHSEWPVAELVYRVACDEFRIDGNDAHDNESDDNSDSDDLFLRFEDQIEAAMDNFEHAINLLEMSIQAKSFFLKNFDDWSSDRERNVQRLKEIAEEIQDWNYGCDIAQVCGGTAVVIGGVLIGLSCIPALAPFTVPLLFTGTAKGIVGSGVSAVAYGVKTFQLKNKLEESNTLITQDKSIFSETVSPWFVHTKELKKAIESLVSYNLLKEMSEDLQDFHDLNGMDLIADGFVLNRFKQVLKLCIQKMRRLSNIMRSFDVVIAPAVITFVIVVCLLRYDNWNVLDCALQTDRLEKSRRFSSGRAHLVQKNCLINAGLGVVFVNVVVEIINVVRASIDIYNRPMVEDAEKMKDAAELLEDEFAFVKRVFDELVGDELLLSYEDETLTAEDIAEILDRCDRPFWI